MFVCPDAATNAAKQADSERKQDSPAQMAQEAAVDEAVLAGNMKVCQSPSVRLVFLCWLLATINASRRFIVKHSLSLS